MANKSLNFIVRLRGHDAFGRENEIAIVKVPRALPRLIRMPKKVVPDGMLFVSLSSIVRAHLEDLFPGREVTEFSQFRVTRIPIWPWTRRMAESAHRLAARPSATPLRTGGAPEVSAGCSRFLSDFLLQQFDLPNAALYPCAWAREPGAPESAGGFGERSCVALSAMWSSAWPRQLQPGVSIMGQLRERDVLIHQPFESFDGLLAFLREAVNDPQVLVIKQTIYRTGSDSELMDLLSEAVRRGKEVMAVVELKARFDEEANINWAEALESIGAQVVYGVVGLQDPRQDAARHATRGRQLRRYGHLSTGNYNVRTAKLYTD